MYSYAGCCAVVKRKLGEGCTGSLYYSYNSCEPQVYLKIKSRKKYS